MLPVNAPRKGLEGDPAAGGGGTGAPEIEITPKMIEAGETVIFEFRDDVMASTLAERVYRAMEQARTNPQR